MPWKEQPTKIADHLECLRTDAGAFVGFVIRFNAAEFTHAWTEHKRLGTCTTIGQAKDLVEEHMEKMSDQG